LPRIPGLRVVRSSIHGYGVVAERAFSKGELIAEVDGIVWSEDEHDVDDTYSLWLGGGRYLDMLDQTRWINHSCEPNAEIMAESDPAWAHIVAVQRIAPGEEITYDYAFTAEVAERCACGAPACRGWIVDPDELPRLRAMMAEGDGD
jgi:SET domain-containing protein